MSDSSSLINVGELAKPVTALIERIADATGVLYEPRRIRNRAKAEAEADLIKAHAQIEISDLQRRALKRFVEEEAKHQANIEEITEAAIPLLTDGATPEAMEEDWIANFFDRCRIVSDEEMQSLWAKVLAGEANSPSSFSKRTVNLLASLDKADANIFTQLCSFGFYMGVVLPLVYDLEDGIYREYGINFASLKHLEFIGLISFDSLGGFARKGQFEMLPIAYYGAPIRLTFAGEGEKVFGAGKVMLTQAGEQLAPICGSKRSDKILDYVLGKWIEQRLNPYSPYPRET
jgi:hypothetical protein